MTKRPAFAFKIPDLTAPRAMALLAVAIAVLVTGMLYAQDAKWMPVALGDTDDATRMVMVRELLAGRGWYDQHWMRMQPPVGLYMHWSRLLDGGIASLTLLFRQFTDIPTAELLTRIVWPGLWVIPAAGAVLWGTKALATALGGADRAQGAMVAAVMLLAANLSIYAQFHPGRIDHHNAQIALTLLALAGAMQPPERTRAAIISGLAMGLALAIGLEALFFQAAIAAMIGLRLLTHPGAAKSVERFGWALALSTLGAYAIQTPPERWSLSACDAIGLNLTAGVVAGGVVLALAARLTAGRSLALRLAGLGLAGAAALGLYLGIYPNCIHGPFADVDPRIKPIWLNNVSEVANLPLLYTRHADSAILLATPCLLGALAIVCLTLNRSASRNPAWQVLALVMLVGLAVGFSAVRMGSYPSWFAMIPLAVAANELARRYEDRMGLFAALGAALLISPMGWGGLAVQADNALPPLMAKLNPSPKTAARAAAKAKKEPTDYCFNNSPYAVLAGLPKGLTVSEIDLGPFVLANSPSSTLSAPYHRMGWGIMTARGILSAHVDTAQALIAKQGVTYVLDCPLHSNHADRVGLSKDALQKRLDANDPPAWLQRVTPANATGAKGAVIVYRVLEPAKTQ
jgi:hypothetical protein